MAQAVSLSVTVDPGKMTEHIPLCGGGKVDLTPACPRTAVRCRSAVELALLTAMGSRWMLQVAAVVPAAPAVWARRRIFRSRKTAVLVLEVDLIWPKDCLMLWHLVVLSWQLVLADWPAQNWHSFVSMARSGPASPASQWSSPGHLPAVSRC